MATCLNYNCADLEDHEVDQLQCSGPHPGGISEAVFILCGQNLSDPTSGTEVNALIDADDAKLVQRIRMGITGAEPTLSPKTTSCGLPATLYVTYTGTITDYSWSNQNMTFWNTLAGGYTVGGAILRQCDTQSQFDDTSIYLNGEISFSGGPIVPDDDADPARFEITWSFRGTMSLIATPAGVFS